MALLGMVLLLVLPGALSHAPLVVMSMDGLRLSYLSDRYPNFQRLRDGGAFAEAGMKPPAVTKTFPGHYSMATGLHQESHGILGNTMYDAQRNEFYFLSKTADSVGWFLGEPIWVTAVKQGLRSAVYYWPGSEAIINGTRPTEYMDYNKSTPFSDRIETVGHWLANSTGDVIMMYIEEPDSTGHTFGPDSQEVREKMAEVDGYLGMVLDIVDHAGANFILVSDHGMTDIDDKRTVYLEDYMDTTLLGQSVDSRIKYAERSPLLSLHTSEDHLVDMVVESLSQGDAGQRLRVYRRSEIPEEWHIKNSHRVGDVVAVAELGWSIAVTRSTGVSCDREQGIVGFCGNHGYRNDEPSMRAIFFAYGPDFKAGSRLTEPINAVDVYPLMCTVTGLTPAPNNGTVEVFAGIMHDSSSWWGVWHVALVVAGGLVLVGLSALVALRVHRKGTDTEKGHELRECDTSNPNPLEADESTVLCSSP